MKTKNLNLFILLLLFIGSISLFLGFDLGEHYEYILPKRLIRMATMALVAVAVAYSSLIFQTITNNRILTPAIMGYESVFILIQTILIYMYGDVTFRTITQTNNFFIAIGGMLIYSSILYFILFKKGKQNIYLLLLIGVVLGTLFEKISQFFQIILDPNEFSMLETKLFVSFNKMNTDLLIIATILTIITLLIIQPFLKYLDVIALGKEHAINLGLDYEKLIRFYMMTICVLVSVSTALVGPIAFLGIMVTNICYELFPTNKHKKMVWYCSVIACIILFLGQFLVEHVFNFSTTTSIIINFIGGVYFIYLILKSTQKK
ncbi:iron chelate uptake ABC transporter family permease subunit [Empedobacter brevis]|uniref:iron chelate uptake ABC transporter family permease subunit n=1 Tax=Empedobacter brevis TaxID=247 RepID=UPI0039B0B7ED